jgi:hypothetical protein
MTRTSAVPLLPPQGQPQFIHGIERRTSPAACHGGSINLAHQDEFLLLAVGLELQPCILSLGGNYATTTKKGAVGIPG